jgi:hypothetical protein
MILVVVIILACRFGNVVHHHLARATRIASPPSRRVHNTLHVARDQRIPGRVKRRFVTALRVMLSDGAGAV